VIIQRLVLQAKFLTFKMFTQCILITWRKVVKIHKFKNLKK